ncbi:hypothetical protein BBJ28_00005874 [Nothophytophthora sp. Chile5]|nr:hypothetical protein BBJ28_00005874 [Nothophytophthora sp. Chile5]
MRLPRQQLMSFAVRSFVAPGGDAPGPFLREQVRVRLSPRFGRLPHPDAAVEAAVARSWDEFRRRSPRVFNASKFRLARWRARPGALELQCGVTDYRTYLGTCCSSLAPRLLADAPRADAFAFLSRKVGVAAVLETADAHVALIQRSRSVGMYQDLYDTPGGHPEPTHIQLTAEELATLELPGNEARREALETAARDELFRSVAAEVQEEVNVAPALLAAPLLLGVVLQTAACTPSFGADAMGGGGRAAALLTEVSVCLRAFYAAGPADKFESVRLELLPAAELLATDPAGMELTPSAQGSLALWRRWRQQQSEQKD